MPPQLRGFGGPGVAGPFHQPGFGSHGQPQALGGNQYLGASAQINPFGGPGNGGFNAAAGLNGAPGFDGGFGSQSARMGFGHAPVSAGLQQQQQQQQQHGGQLQHNMLMDPSAMRSQGNRGRIREVWKHNLHEEMAVLRDLVDHYPYIAMVRLSDRRRSKKSKRSFNTE